MVKELSQGYNDIREIIIGQNGRDIFYIAEKENGKEVVVKNGKEISKEYNSIQNLKVSKDGNNFAFVTSETIVEKNGSTYFKWYVIKNDKKISKDYAGIRKILAGPDFKNIFLIAEKKVWKEFIVKITEENKEFKEEKISGIYKSIDTNNIYLSSDGEDIICKAEESKEKYVICKNGKKITEEYSFIQSFQPLPNGKGFIFLADKNENKGYVIAKIIGNKEEIIKDTNYFFIDNLIFSPDLKDIIFRSQNENKKYVIVRNDNEISEEYKWITKVKLSKDKKNIFYIVKTDNEKFAIVRNNREINKEEKITNEYEMIEDYVVLPNGEDVVFTAKTDDGKRVVARNKKDKEEKEDEEIKEFDKEYKKVGRFMLLSDGGFIIKTQKENGRWIIIKNGEEFTNEYHDIEDLQVLPNGKDFVFIGYKDPWKKVIVKNNEEIEEVGNKYSSIKSLKHTPDGKYIIFVGCREGKCFLVRQEI